MLMQMDSSVRRRLIRDALISLFIYALPVLLMLTSFWVSGQRPWKKPAVSVAHSKTAGPKPGDPK
jgi:hypothetical protein